MAPRLTSTGVRFNDNTELNSKYGIVPKNSTAVFYQAAAPTGWTRNTSHNSKALRLVNSGGGGSGGASSFPSVFTSYNVTNRTANLSATLSAFTISESEMPNHNHGLGASGASRRLVGGGEIVSGFGLQPDNPRTGDAGSEQGHGHPITATCTYGYSFNISVKYIDVNICSFN